MVVFSAATLCLGQSLIGGEGLRVMRMRALFICHRRDRKWGFYSYGIRRITNLLKNTNVIFRTNNTIYDILKTRRSNTSICLRSVIYQLQCQTYDFTCIGQTGSGLKKIQRTYHIYHLQYHQSA